MKFSKYFPLSTAILAFLIPLTVYVKTLPPTIIFGDAGEFVTAAYFLGIPHPPGAPLWVILAHLFTKIPINSVAWRVTFASSVFAAATCLTLFCLLYETIRAFFLKKFPKSFFPLLLAAMLCFAFSRSLWGEALIPKYFTLLPLLFSLQLITLRHWLKEEKNLWHSQAPTGAWLFVFCFLLGISLTTHYLFLLLLPAYAIWIAIVKGKSMPNVRLLGGMLLFLSLGLLLFAYLPIRAQANPPINWGNPHTWERFAAYVTRRQFGVSFASASPTLGGVYLPIKRAQSITEYVKRIPITSWAFIVTLESELGPVLAALGVLGFFLTWRMPDQEKFWRRWLLLLLLLFLSSGVGYAVATDYQIPTRHGASAQFLFAYLVFFLWVGYGMVFLVHRILEQWKGRKITTVVVIGSFTLPLFLLSANLHTNDWSSHRVALDHGINILQHVDHNAIVIADRNIWLFPLLYLHTVEKVRPDVTIYDRSGNLFERIYDDPKAIFHSRQDLDEQRRKVEEKLFAKFPDRPVYYALDKDFENYSYNVAPEGILYKRNAATAKIVDFPSTYSSILSLTDLPWQDTDTEYLVSYYHLRFGDWLASQGRKPEALSEYNKAYTFGKNHTIALGNVAVTFWRIGEREKAKTMYDELLKQDPFNTVALSNLAQITVEEGDGKRATDLLGQLERGLCVEAEEEYTQLLGATITDKVVLNNIGICYARKQDYPKAKSYWEKALTLDPGYAQAKENLKQLGTRGK